MAISALHNYKAPKGVNGAEEIRKLQKALGVRADGVWGPVSQGAYAEYLKRFREPLSAQYQIEGYSAPGMVRNQTDVKRMQEILGNVDVDGIWGPETDAAYKKRRAEENMRDDAGSVLSAASVNMAAGIAAKLRLAAPAKPGGSVLLPTVDNKTALPYTGGENIPKVQVYQQAILNALTKPAAIATAMKTTNSGKTDIGKYTISSVPNAAPAKIEPLKGQDNPIQGSRLVERPVDEFDGAYKKRPSKEGDTSKGAGYEAFALRESKDDAVWYASNILNLTTARENKESCCNLYSAVIDGKRVYFTGEVFVGEWDNVVEPYLADALWEKQRMRSENTLKSFKYEGFIHAHPYYTYSDYFSEWPGDSAVALLSGEIYLTTPNGNIYRLAVPEDIQKNIMEDYNDALAKYISSMLPQGSVDAVTAINYADSLETLAGWFANPPTKPYNDLHSINTTEMSTFSTTFTRDIQTIIQRIIERYLDKWDKRWVTAFGVK